MKTKFPLWALAINLILSLGISGETPAPSASNAPRHFGSPDEAVKALVSAAQAHDKQALHAIFGPEVQELLTRDEVQDKAHLDTFARAVSDRCVAVTDSPDKRIVEIGADRYPFPIPLVRMDGQWAFDTHAGKEEIVSRHIGSDELHAIGVCRAYVEAQKEYAAQNPQLDGIKAYATKLKSDPGQKNGLYWEPSAGQSRAPLQALVDAAREEGYSKESNPTDPKQFHGYHFKILTAQGASAPGGRKDYLVNGSLTRGFALVAYPAKFGQSGIMTFIVGQDGKVYQRNLGPQTSETAAAMTDYNPDSKWTLVHEKGVIEGGKELARNSRHLKFQTPATPN